MFATGSVGIASGRSLRGGGLGVWLATWMWLVCVSGSGCMRLRSCLRRRQLNSVRARIAGRRLDGGGLRRRSLFLPGRSGGRVGTGGR